LRAGNGDPVSHRFLSKAWSENTKTSNNHTLLSKDSKFLITNQRVSVSLPGYHRFVVEPGVDFVDCSLNGGRQMRLFLA